MATDTKQKLEIIPYRGNGSRNYVWVFKLIGGSFVGVVNPIDPATNEPAVTGHTYWAQVYIDGVPNIPINWEDRDDFINEYEALMKKYRSNSQIEGPRGK